MLDFITRLRSEFRLIFIAPILDVYCPVNFLISKFILFFPSSIFTNSRRGTANGKSIPAEITKTDRQEQSTGY